MRSVSAQPATAFRDEHLACAFYSRAIVDHGVYDADGTPKILFTSVPTNFADYKLFPNIVHAPNNGHWVRTPIPSMGDGWNHVHVSQDGEHWLAIMDNVPESPGSEAQIVVSNDGGNTWSYGESLRKYVYFDGFRYLKLDEKGSGAAIEHYVGDVDGYDQIGYYIYETHDWGVTWSQRSYREAYDTSGYTDTFPGAARMRASRTPLSEISLPGFEGCPNPL